MQSVERMTFQGRAKRQNLDAKKIGDKGVGVPASLGVYFLVLCTASCVCKHSTMVCAPPLECMGVCAGDSPVWCEVRTQCMPLTKE